MASKKWVAMLLAGGQGTRLGDLTHTLAKPAVPFGGKYRIIDFTLSNCTNSGIDTVGVLTQYQPHLLNAYIGNGSAWDLDRNHGGVSVLPPYVGKDGGRWYAGTANAVYQNISFIDQYHPEHVVVISGDHIYRMDYNLLLDYHEEKNADATLAVIRVPWEETNRFGIMNTDENQKIVEFEEKPQHAKSNLASMGVYIFKWSVLKKYLQEDELNLSSNNDFGKDIIPKMLQHNNEVYAYQFNEYWKDVGTVKSLWEAHMDLLESDSKFPLDDQSWKTYSSQTNHPPQYIAPTASIQQSLINEGCQVYGSVTHSVISFNVTIGSGTKIYDSVIMPDVKIGKNCRIYQSVIASGTVIEDNAVIGDPNETEGIILIGGNQVVTSNRTKKSLQ